MDIDDNILVSDGTGPWLRATDVVNGIHYPIFKLDIGLDGESAPVVGSLPITVAGSSGSLDVVIQDVTSETVDLYLYRLDVSLTLTSPISLDDIIFSIASNANVVNGNAITIYEGTNFYQALVVASTESTVTVSTPCDKEFSTSATVEVGPWNMAVNGSVTPQTFAAHPPEGLDFDIYGLTLSGLSETIMDASTFLGIEDGITNGVLIRSVNTITKNLGLIVRNLGFEEFGYITTYIPANKKTEYGIIARTSFSDQNGVAIRLHGDSDDSIQIIVRDDLTTETLFACVIRGHVVTY